MELVAAPWGLSNELVVSPVLVVAVGMLGWLAMTQFCTKPRRVAPLATRNRPS